MPRKKIDNVKLTGRISENNTPKEAIAFLERHLKNSSQAELIREAVLIWWKYRTGQLFEDDLEDKLTTILANTNLKVEATGNEGEDINQQVQTEIESEIESQFDADGNFNFNF